MRSMTELRMLEVEAAIWDWARARAFEWERVVR